MSYNVNNDLLSWQLLLESETDLVVSINKVSKDSFISTRKELNTLLNKDNKITEYLKTITNNWFDNNPELIKEVTKDSNTWPIWDEILTAYITGNVELERSDRPVMNNSGILSYSSKGSIEWIVSSDSNRVWRDLNKRLGEVK